MLSFIKKMAFANDKEHPSRYVHTATSPTADGNAPPGAVAAGRARNPPPIVVPAIRAACDATVVLVLPVLASSTSDAADADDPSVREKRCEVDVQRAGVLMW